MSRTRTYRESFKQEAEAARLFVQTFPGQVAQLGRQVQAKHDALVVDSASGGGRRRRVERTTCVGEQVSDSAVDETLEQIGADVAQVVVDHGAVHHGLDDLIQA